MVKFAGSEGWGDYPLVMQVGRYMIPTPALKISSMEEGNTSDYDGLACSSDIPTVQGVPEFPFEKYLHAAREPVAQI